MSLEIDGGMCRRAMFWLRRLRSTRIQGVPADDAENEVPTRLFDIRFLARFQSDVLREFWRVTISEDLEFSQIIEELGDRKWNPKMDRYRMLWQLLRAALHLPGDVIECGVYKGPSARLMGLAMLATNKKKKLLLLDTFTGLPEPAEGLDGLWKRGDLGNVEFHEVVAYLEDLKNAVLLPGLFADTFPKIAGQRFCFSHIDCDIYPSVKECCEFLYERTVPGGYLVFDDYGVPYCPGAKLAVDEFFADKPERLIHLPTGQSVVIKIGGDTSGFQTKAVRN